MVSGSGTLLHRNSYESVTKPLNGRFSREFFEPFASAAGQAGGGAVESRSTRR